MAHVLAKADFRDCQVVIERDWAYAVLRVSNATGDATRREFGSPHAAFDAFMMLCKAEVPTL